MCIRDRVRAVDRIVDLCQRDLAFIWLTKGQKPQRDVFYDFKGKKLTGEVLDEDVYKRQEVDSSEMAFHIAGSLAFKDAMKKAAPVLLEPIMKVEVTMPEEYMGDVIGDINSRRGRIEGMDDLGGGKILHAYVCLLYTSRCV